MAATQPSATPSTPADAPEASLASSTTASEAASSSKDATDSSKASSISPEERDLFQKHLLNQCVTRDWIHSSCISSAQQSLERTLKDRHLEAQEYRRVRSAEGRQQWFTPSRLYGQGYNGFGNGHTDGPPRILYPRDKPRPGKKPPTPFRWSRKELKEQSEQHEELVPIRLDVDWDKIKLRDTFTWNLHDRITPIEHFAAQLIDDMGVKQPATQPVYDQVLQQMHEQINDFYPFAFTAEDALDPELPYSAYKNDEMRILIKLNITIGQHTLVDQFEWDISNVDNEPEKFATVMAEELSLSGEFKTAIAHCIREQTQLFTKSLYTIGHPFDGRPVEDADLVSAMLPSPLPSVFRPQQQAKDYGPFLYELSEADLERNEVVFSREQRRQKRSVNRRGGPILPDLKERQRTIRTLLVSSVLPGAATDIEDSRLYKRPAGANRRRGPGARDGDISDSEESDDSAPDSPAMSQLQGTARTRNMRGAASAAQQRMANLGRSETPEASVLHHHETRVSSRRHGHLREETEEPQQFVVTLRVSKEKLRKLMQNLKNRRAMSRSETPAAQTHGRAASASTPGVMGPPATPSAPTASSASTTLGRIPAPPPPPPGQPPHTPPPPPKWLQDCLTVLCQRSYENDKFEGTMRYSAINTDTDQVVSQPPNPLPKNITYVWLPRIRCLDCPGKLYNPGPEMTAGNFEVHLKNRGHREKVDARIKSGGKSAVAGSSGAGGGGSGASPAAAMPAP